MELSIIPKNYPTMCVGLQTKNPATWREYTLWL